MNTSQNTRCRGEDRGRQGGEKGGMEEKGGKGCSGLAGLESDLADSSNREISSVSLQLGISTTLLFSTIFTIFVLIKSSYFYLFCTSFLM